MSDTPNLVLDHLRAIRARLEDVHASQATHSRRLTAVEQAIQRLRSDLAADAGAAIQRSADIEERIATIERRLELRDDA